MKQIYLDGMLSGTGIRDDVNGGYIELEDLGVSDSLAEQISNWLDRYERVHFENYKSIKDCERLDADGLSLVESLRGELMDYKIDYYSNWKLSVLTPPSS